MTVGIFSHFRFDLKLLVCGPIFNCWDELRIDAVKSSGKWKNLLGEIRE